MSRFFFNAVKQQDAMDCGPTCLKMIAQHYGRSVSRELLRERCNFSRQGVSLQGISEAAESIGFRTLGASLTIDDLKGDAPLPFIAHWKQRHFVVVHKIARSKFYVADPAFGLITYTTDEFKAGWISNRTDEKETGIALLLEPTPQLFDEKEKQETSFSGRSQVRRYFAQHRKLFLQLLAGMVAGSLIQLLLPFLTQSIVDTGISQRDVQFVYVILAAQLVLFLSRATADFIRSWILLYIGQRINISMVSDFLFKLMRMPIAFFDTKMIGDIMQRIGDHKRIEQFLTASTLNVLFSFFSLFIFGIVLALYDLRILAVFFTGSILYLGWMVIFLKRRRILDYKRFDRMRQNQDKLYQIITGMQEIKLHNCETSKRWEWERIQAQLFRINVESLKLSQYQQAGAVLINEGKNILITFLAALAVIHGEMTLGMMLSVQYIIGQLNSPIDQLIGFMSAAQDARISMERLTEIHSQRDEADDEAERITEFPQQQSIRIDGVSFHYPGMNDYPALRNISFDIPAGKITAVVGTSGSGKTTLLKLLLGFYAPQQGKITVGGQSLLHLSQKVWREKSGVVMQDGFIFSDTIEKNIAPSGARIDKERLRRAAGIACIREFIETLPNGFQTVIGAEGQSLSAGQRQRILIARAVYKNPDYIYFDEATNALDANNEKQILENLDQFFRGKTVVVVAHRLSTVRNADQIIVMENGRIVESGTHSALTAQRSSYYHLVKNQLELGT